MDIYGKIPKSLEQSLLRLNVVISDVQTVGDDIDVVIDNNGVTTVLYAIYVGNNKWVIDELLDDANLFPTLEEGDSISLDAITKLFTNSINSSFIPSSLILSFNPLGEVKYGIKDKIDNLKEKRQRIKDWANNVLYAEDAEEFIRKNGPYRRTFTDARDGQTRTKKDYNASRVNVGKIQQISGEGKGHYKVLSGNPATQDFQVWHLYKNGNKIRCLDVKTGLKPQEAQWVYENNIPESWSEDDWNPEGEIPQKASKIEIGEENSTPQKEETMTDTESEEDNVVEEPQNENDIHSFVEDFYNDEEDNVFDDDDDWLENENVGTTEEDNVVEEPKKKKKKTIKSSIEDSDSDFGDDIEEDNIIESKPTKKSKYNGKNVTGCAQPDGTVVMASVEEDNVIEGNTTALISCSLILSRIEDFQKYIKQYNLENKPKQVLTQLLTRLMKLPGEDRNNITKDSNNNVLIINFGNTNLTTENYMAQFEIYDDEVVSKVNLGKGNSMTGDDAIKMCTQTLDSIINPS